MNLEKIPEEWREVYGWKNLNTVIDAAHLLFTAYGWTWHDKKEPPTRSEIEEQFLDLAKDAIERKCGNLQTGRLMVLLHRTDDRPSEIEFLIAP